MHDGVTARAPGSEGTRGEKNAHDVQESEGLVCAVWGHWILE